MKNHEPITRMTMTEVDTYLELHGIEVYKSFEEGEYEYWGFTCETGFSTFDHSMNEGKARYGAVIFHRLVNNLDMWFGDAEILAQAFVTTYKVEGDTSGTRQATDAGAHSEHQEGGEATPIEEEQVRSEKEGS